MLKTVLALSLLVGATLCYQPHKRWDDFEVKHEWVEGAPKGWQVLGPAPSDERLGVRIGLKQAGLEDLIGHLHAVSDPSHYRYGQYLSKDEVDALSAPDPDSTILVEDWLLHHDLLHNPESQLTRSASGDWISLSIPIGKLERMLGTKYHVYKHIDTETTLIRTTSYSLPSVLRDHITLITPSTYFNVAKPRPVHSVVQQPEGITFQVADGISNSWVDALGGVPPTCKDKITPSCLDSLYNISYTPASTKNNSLGVTGYLDQFANHADLKTFLKKFRPGAASADFKVVKIANGGDDQNKPGSEANLDIQYTIGLTYPTRNIFFSVGGSPPFKPDGNTPNNTNEPYIPFLDYILAQESIPQTITTSYGDDEQTVPVDYAYAACMGFAALGVRGVSLLFSSGDFGVGAGDCKTNDGKSKLEFLPDFPASCPYVTTVGGTTGIAPEQAVYFSGGGFSNYFSRPFYQSKAVDAFLATLGDTYAGLYNRHGRAYPDVAAQGLNFQIVVGGTVLPIGGTSASSPTFAGVVSLLNDALLAAGRPPLGFLNPWLYSGGYKGLNDIVGGNNPGCGTPGFKAIKGWDPVTGLGTPNFGLLKHIALAGLKNADDE